MPACCADLIGLVKSEASGLPSSSVLVACAGGLAAVGAAGRWAPAAAWMGFMIWEPPECGSSRILAAGEEPGRLLPWGAPGPLRADMDPPLGLMKLFSISVGLVCIFVVNFVILLPLEIGK